MVRAATSSSRDLLNRAWYACLTAKSSPELLAQAISINTRFPGCHFLAASFASHASLSARSSVHRSTTLCPQIPQISAQNTEIGDRRRGSNLEVAGDLAVEGLEEVLVVGLAVSLADGAALGGGAVAEDGDDQRLIGAPTCHKNEKEIKTYRSGSY